jgi:hypothetical protein
LIQPVYYYLILYSYLLYTQGFSSEDSLCLTRPRFQGVPNKPEALRRCEKSSSRTVSGAARGAMEEEDYFGEMSPAEAE